MRKDEGGLGGTIINVSSTAALVHNLDILPVYSGSKAAVLHFSRSLSVSNQEAFISHLYCCERRTFVTS